MGLGGEGGRVRGSQAEPGFGVLGCCIGEVVQAGRGWDLGVGSCVYGGVWGELCVGVCVWGALYGELCVWGSLYGAVGRAVLMGWGG